MSLALTSKKACMIIFIAYAYMYVKIINKHKEGNEYVLYIYEFLKEINIYL